MQYLAHNKILSTIPVNLVYILVYTELMLNFTWTYCEGEHHKKRS